MNRIYPYILFALSCLVPHYCHASDLVAQVKQYLKPPVVQEIVDTNFSFGLRWIDTGLTWFAYVWAIKLAAQGLFVRPNGTKLEALSLQTLFYQPLSAESQKCMRDLSVDDFATMLEAHLAHHDEDQQKNVRKAIVTQYNLYQFEPFVRCIMEWPEFKAHMHELHEYLINTPEGEKQFELIPGFQPGEFCTFIHLQAQEPAA
jgi:hypothetical protein